MTFFNLGSVPGNVFRPLELEFKSSAGATIHAGALLDVTQFYTTMADKQV